MQWRRRESLRPSQDRHGGQRVRVFEERNSRHEPVLVTVMRCVPGAERLFEDLVGMQRLQCEEMAQRKRWKTDAIHNMHTKDQQLASVLQPELVNKLRAILAVKLHLRHSKAGKILSRLGVKMRTSANLQRSAVVRHELAVAEVLAAV
jgi:hypothetical protein